MTTQNSAVLKASSALDYFRTDDLQANLARRTARSGFLTLCSIVFNGIVTTVSTIWLTRILEPADFGLYGMVLVITNFANMFVDLGLTRAVIQKPHITHPQVSTLFWINLGISSGIAAGIALATPLVVRFYDEPRVAAINIVMAGSLVISGLMLQHRALLQRRMEFGKINLVAAIAPFNAAVVGIAIALLGGGYWALVAVPIVNQLSTCIGMWIACRWRPGLPRRGTGVRQMLAFGGHVTGFQFINYFSRNADYILLGYVWGKVSLGLYTRVYTIMMLPSNRLTAPLNNVLIPSLSRLVDSPEKYRKFFLGSLELLAVLTAIPTLLLILTAPELVPLVLGDNWRESVPLFLALGPAVIVACTISASSWLYLSFGHVERQTFAGTINMFVMVAAILVGLSYGPLGVALGVTIARLGCNLPYVAYSCRGTPVSAQDYVKSVSWPIWMSTFSALGAMLIVVGYLKNYVFVGQPLPPLWEALPLSNGQLLVIMLVKLLAWLVLFGLLLFVFPGARKAIIIRPMNSFQKLRGKTVHP